MKNKEEKTKDKLCGLVMPISAIDGCSEQHWNDVKSILTNTVESAGFKANLVSYADDVGIIQKRIIQNLYENPIVICDVSGKNPNVMFELGMRLAFDKPTIIIKDDKTAYSFDTSPIEHLEYPRDLRFSKIIDFQTELKEKVEATYSKSMSNPSYTTFLKHFGTFTVAKLDTIEISKEEYILEELKDIKKSVQRQGLLLQESSMKKDIIYETSQRALRSRIRRSIRSIRRNELSNIAESELLSSQNIALVKKLIVSNEEIQNMSHNKPSLARIIEEEYINAFS